MTQNSNTPKSNQHNEALPAQSHSTGDIDVAFTQRRVRTTGRRIRSVPDYPADAGVIPMAFFGKRQ